MPPFPDSLARSIISALAAPHASLDAVAKAHGISVADLCLWLSTPAARVHLDPLERGACAAVRVAATLNLNAAIDTLTQILNDFRNFAKAASQNSGKSGLSPSDPTYQRAAIHARRAAHHLGRLARVVPIDEAHIQDMLAAARVRAQNRASGSSATGCLSASAPGLSSSPSPSSPSAPPPLRPSAPSSHSPTSPPRSSASSAFNIPSSPLRNSASSATSAFSSSSTPAPRSSAPASLSRSPSKLGDSLAERTPPPPTRGGPQDRRGLLPADLIRAATGPPLPRGSSP